MLLLTLLLHYAIHYITRSRFEPRTYAKGLVLRARHVVGDAFTRGGGDNAASFPAACSQDYCNFAIFPQDKGLLISRPERAALLFGTLRDRINAALTSRLRDYPNYSGWDLIQVTRKYAGNEWWTLRQRVRSIDSWVYLWVKRKCRVQCASSRSSFSRTTILRAWKRREHEKIHFWILQMNVDFNRWYEYKVIVLWVTDKRHVYLTPWLLWAPIGA